MPEILTIESLGPKGDGVATIDGRKVYVPRGAVGDTLNLDIRENSDGVLHGSILEIISHGEGRVAAPCIYYEACGGCQIQHIPETNYRDWKIATVDAALSRVGVSPEIKSEPVFIPNATRRRATFAAFKIGKEVTLGFHQAKSHNVQAIDHCLLLTDSMNTLLANIKPWLAKILKEKTPTDIQIQEIDGGIEVILIGPLSRNGEADTVQRKLIAEMCEELMISRVGWQAKDFADLEPVISISPVTKKYGDMVVEIPMGMFLQPSSEGEAALAALVMAGMPNSKGKMKIADLFSGCGTFSGPSLKLGTVHAVEQNKRAVTAVQLAAKKVPGLTAEQRDLALEPLTTRELKNYDVVILDPPRAGAKEQCEKLAKSTVPTVISVSCNPATFARDAKILVDGGYKFKKMTMVDQFIWSPHTELVGIFSRI